MRDVLARDDDPARVRLQKSHDVVERDRFSHAAAAENTDGFTRVNVEADVIEHAALAERFADVLKVDVRLVVGCERHRESGMRLRPRAAEILRRVEIAERVRGKAEPGQVLLVYLR